MSTQPNPYKDPLKIRNYTIFGVFVWTVFIAISLSWNINLIKNEALNRAFIYTKVGFDKDLLYRRWVAEHGGVYVRVDSTTPPNPYLSHLDNRDITIDSNVQLTLMNPAYMTRQVHELQEASSGVLGHITSLNPIRPENAPDAWEEKVLKKFEKGLLKYGEVDTIDGKEYFRFMRPFITEKSCLKCHAQQGYKLKDIRGGISTSYPMEQIYILIYGDIRNQYVLYGLIWILGLGIFVISYQHLKKSDKKRLAAEDSILVLNRQLEEYVNDKTINLEKTNKNLQVEIKQHEVVKEKLLLSEDRFQTIFDSVNDGIFIHDVKTGEILDVNKRVLEMFGFSYNEILKLSVGEISSNVSPYTQNEAIRWINKALLGQPQIFEWQSKHKNGTIFWSEVNMRFAIINGNERILVTVRDISERKQAELKTAESQQRFEALFNFGADAVFVHPYSESGFKNFIEVNQIACDLFGYSREELLNLKASNISSKPDADQKGAEEHRGKLKKTKHMIFEAKMVKKSGEVFPVEISSTIFDYQEQRVIMSVVRDITVRKRVEEELTIEKEFSEKIINTSTAIIIGLDKNHLIRIFNKGAEKLTGYTEVEVIGKDWFKTFFPKELLEEMNKVWKDAWGIQSHSYENPILIKTGEERMISWQNTGFYEGEDSTKHLLISIGEDITERKQTEEELEKHREQLEELVKERTKELEDKNKALERTNKAFVGRELRMKELKEEIEKLK